MRPLNRPLLGLALLVTSATVAGAQVQHASAHARLQQSLDAQSYRAVSLVFDSAQARGIPVAPLVNRALQGILHRTPGPAVRDAVAKHAERLAIAQAALGASSTEAELSAGANALALGVRPVTLAEIRTLWPGRAVTVPLGMLTQLIAQKTSVGSASEMVVALMRNGATPAQLVSLSDDVKHDVDAGIDPGAALDIRSRGILGTMGQALTDDGDRLMRPPGTDGTPTSGSRPVNSSPPPKATRKP